MKGKRVITSQYASEVFSPTGRNVEIAEAIICQGCTVMPDCNPRHPECAIKKAKERKNANINV